MKLAWRTLLLFVLLLVAAGLALPAHYQVRFPAQPGPHFDQYIRRIYKEALETQKPGLVLMGDSTLESAVDAQLLEQQLGEPILDIAIRGSSSALWYLILKNNLLEASYLPHTLVLVTRDTELTSPGFRVQGTYLKQLDEYAHRNEPLVTRLSFLNFMSPLEIGPETYLPLYGLRLSERRDLEAAARSALPRLAGCNEACMQQALSGSLGGGNLDPGQAGQAIAAAEEYLYEPELLDFQSQLDRSYLPEYIRLAREHNLRLVVVQLKTYPASGPELGYAALRDYLPALRGYLEANQVAFLDFGDDPRIPEEYFKDPIHLNDQGREVFTGLLAEALRPVLGGLEYDQPGQN